MTYRMPDELKPVARFLMAGEDVRFCGKPDTRALLTYAVAVSAAAFLGLLIVMTIFFDSTASIKAIVAVLFALASTGIAEFWLFTTTYVVTDKRILVVSGISNEINDSCQIEEVSGARGIAIGSVVLISRRNGSPLRLLGVPKQSEFMRAIEEQLSHS